ncbi:hypothetical protein K502DRAFT_345864 [Neoconidiobolus thromboides FSU 785]|nr:hypothetical protein K502DRAFT_345864 [Neoconidiobolus thromboides FSU 785]
MISTKLTTALAFLDVVHQVVSRIGVITPPPRKSKHNKKLSWTTIWLFLYHSNCAAESTSVQLSSSAAHSGSHCQFSVSRSSYGILIPATVPFGAIVFAWAWINRSGKRGSITRYELALTNLESHEVFLKDSTDDYKKSEIVLTENNQKKLDNSLKEGSKKDRPEEKKPKKRK